MSKTFEAYCADNQIDAATLNEHYRKVVTAAWKAEESDKNGNTDDPGRAAIEAARRREDLTREIGQMISSALESKRINADTAERINLKAQAENWDKLRTENEILKAERPQVGVIQASEQLTHADIVIEAAVCKAGGLDNIEKHYDARTLEAADKHFRHGLGLQDLIAHFAKRGGFRGSSLKAALNGPEVLRCAFRGDDGHRDIRAGVQVSTYNLPTVFNNVANKFLRAGFEGVDQTWREIAATRSVTDFKQITTASLTGGMIYKQLPPGGEIEHGSAGETTYTNQVNTQALMFGIDRRDLINDDLGALTGVSRRLGRGGALRLNEMFWTEFLDNASFFSSGNNNVITGGTSVLSGATGLEALRLADAEFADQTDPDGLPIAIRPKILLVPSGLRISALTLMNSTQLTGTTTANALQPTTNVFAGAYRVVDTPYLSNTSISGSSTTAWYLLADPMDMPVIEVAFLNGVQTPTIETTDADFNTLGIALRGYFDPGVAKQEYRGGLRAAGA